MKTPEQFDAEIAAADAEIEATQKAANKAWAPWQTKLDELKARAEAAYAPFKEAYEAAKAKKHDLTCAKWEQERAKVKATVESSVPDLKTFTRFAIWAKGLLDKQFIDFHNYTCTEHAPELRAPKVPGLKLLAIQEWEDKGAKFYGAWNEKTGKAISFLSVEPARHAADATQAFGLINGQPVKFEEDVYTGVKEPVKAWIRQLRAAIDLK